MRPEKKQKFEFPYLCPCPCPSKCVNLMNVHLKRMYIYVLLKFSLSF